MCSSGVSGYVGQISLLLFNYTIEHTTQQQVGYAGSCCKYLPQDSLMFTIQVAPSAGLLSKLPTLQSKGKFIKSTMIDINLFVYVLKVHSA